MVGATVSWTPRCREDSLKRLKIEYCKALPEPAWTQLVEETLLSGSGYRSSLALLPEARRARVEALRASAREGRSNHCFAAWQGETFVGGTVAFQIRPTHLYMQISSVIPSYRRRGVYTALVQHVEAWAREQGFVEISSLHVASNNPVLIAKLKLGFQLTGMRLDPEFGTLVELALPLDPSLDALRRFRSGERSEPPAE